MIVPLSKTQRKWHSARKRTDNKVQTNTILGTGSFKTVYKAHDSEEGIEVAWNRIRTGRMVRRHEERDALQPPGADMACFCAAS